jgi:hypothetical protein
MAYFEVLLWNLPAGIEGNQVKSLSGPSVSGPVFEPVTFGILCWNASPWARGCGVARSERFVTAIS